MTRRAIRLDADQPPEPAAPEVNFVNMEARMFRRWFVAYMSVLIDGIGEHYAGTKELMRGALDELVHFSQPMTLTDAEIAEHKRREDEALQRKIESMFFSLMLELVDQNVTAPSVPANIEIAIRAMMQRRATQTPE